jgi:hypothetical protein
MPDALDSGRVKLQGSSIFTTNIPQLAQINNWVSKATASLSHNPLGKRTSQSSSSAK